MKKLLIVIPILLLGGCAVISDAVLVDARYGYQSYDPCIRCGEKWNGYLVPTERKDRGR